MKFKTDTLTNEIKTTATFFNYIDDTRKNLVDSMTVETDSTISHLSNCLIKVEPMQLNDPTRLFGGKIKSLVINKISVHQAIVSKTNPDEYVAGNVLFEALMSDESLSFAIFETNSKIAPCTFTNALGDSLMSANDGEKQKNSLERINESSNRGDDYFKECIENLLQLVESSTSKASVSKKVAEQINRDVDTLTHNSITNLSYNIERLVEELNKDMSSINVELSSTVNKISKYYSDSKLLELEAPSKSEEFNIIRWILNGEFKTNERVILAKLINTIRRTNTNLDKATVKKLDDWYTDFTNEGRIENYESSYEANGCVEISKISGEPQLFGAYSSKGNYVEMRFASAQMRSRRGNNSLGKINTICHLALTYEDLLVLLRGNANANFIPCTMMRFAGVGVPFKTISVSKEDVFIDNAHNDYKQASSELVNIQLKIKELLINPPLTKKADKEELNRLITLYVTEFKANTLKLKEFHTKDCEDVVEHYKEKLQTSIAEISNCLPDKSKHLLLELTK
jgi:hypothetical protein